MPEFSLTSRARLDECYLALIKVFDRVVETFDCTVICGHRGKVDQDKAVAEGKSQTPWPTSKHNSFPSQAVDVAPYPIDWADREWASFFAGFVLGTAKEMGYTLRWGGDWNGDWKVRDNKFDDLWHFELIP